MSDNRLPPRPTTRRRDIVGPEKEDVTDLSDREIVLRNYDVVLHLRAGVRLEMTMLDYRVQTIEHHLWPGTSPVPRGNTPEWDRRKHVDPLKEFDPEDTDHGSTKLPPGMFAALRQKVTRLETEKSEADAFAAGQENARRDQEKASARRWTNTLRWIKVLVPLIAIVFGGIGYLIKHSIDAPQREKIEQQNERLKQLDK